MIDEKRLDSQLPISDEKYNNMLKTGVKMVGLFIFFLILGYIILPFLGDTLLRVEERYMAGRPSSNIVQTTQSTTSDSGSTQQQSSAEIPTLEDIDFIEYMNYVALSYNDFFAAFNMYPASNQELIQKGFLLSSYETYFDKHSIKYVRFADNGAVIYSTKKGSDAIAPYYAILLADGQSLNKNMTASEAQEFLQILEVTDTFEQ